MATQWPRIYQWLLTTAPTFTGWAGVTVFDGYPISGDNPAVFCTVGFVTDDHAGTYTKTQDPSGGMWQETGLIRSTLAVNSGDTDPTLVRAGVFALADGFEAAVRADRTLNGTLSVESEVTTAVDVLGVQNDLGAAEALVLTLHYFTVT